MNILQKSFSHYYHLLENVDKKSVIIARKLKLEVSEDQHKILLDTLNQYKECVNYVFETGVKNRETSSKKLHHYTYYPLREKHPGLPSALVCAARVRATESLKSIKTATKGKWNTSQPKTKKHPPIRYNLTCCSIGKETISLTTIGGRIKIPIINNPIFKEKVKDLQKSCEISYKESRKQWFLTVFVNIIEPKLTEPTNIVGIDRGVKNIAVLSNNTFFNSNKLRNVINKYRYLRKRLSSKGTKSAKRLRKKISGKENRFRKDINHCITKQIVNLPFDTFVLEDLNIKTKKKKGKAFNSLLSTWSWYQFEQFLKYKATLAGKRVEFVNAAYTSQKCSRCGHTEKANRPEQSVFHCKVCGLDLHGDINGSRNVKQDYITSLGISLGSRVQSITQRCGDEERLVQSAASLTSLELGS